jgi:hypothetical protein
MAFTHIDNSTLARAFAKSWYPANGDQCFSHQSFRSCGQERQKGPVAASLHRALTQRVCAVGIASLHAWFDWRSLRDSNPCFSLERAASWASRRRERGRDATDSRRASPAQPRPFRRAFVPSPATARPARTDAPSHRQIPRPADSTSPPIRCEPRRCCHRPPR